MKKYISKGLKVIMTTVVLAGLLLRASPAFASITASPSSANLNKSQTINVLVSSTSGGTYVRWRTSPTYNSSIGYYYDNNAYFAAAGIWYLHVHAGSEHKVFGPYKREAANPNLPTVNSPSGYIKGNASITMSSNGDNGSTGTDPTDGKTSYYLAGVHRVEYYLDGGSAKVYSGAVSVTTQGSHSIHGRVRDNMGNFSAWTTSTFTIDKTAPSANITSISGANYVSGNNYWVKPNTTVSVFARYTDNYYTSLQYMRAVSTNGDSDARYALQWGGGGAGQWVTSPNISVSSVSDAGGSTQHTAINTNYKITPKTAEKDYYLETWTRDGAGNAVGYTRNARMLKVDGTAPGGNNVRTANITDTGYDVYIDNVTDSRSGVQTVKFPTWTNAGGQNDIRWEVGTYQGSNQWKVHINKANYGNSMGPYTTHVYSYDNVGNSSSRGGIGTSLAKPDLGFNWFGAIDDAGVHQTTLNVGQHYRIRTTMINNGNWVAATSQHGVWNVTSGWALYHYDWSGVLSAGASVTHYTDYTPTAPGVFQLKTAIDHTGVVTESNEGNNWATINVTVVDHNNATLTNDIPSTMLAGQTYTQKVTATNTGTRPWKDSTNHHLGANGDSDPFTSVTRYGMGSTVTNKGENYKFTINMKAPSTPGTYTSDWRMVQDGVEWFGGITSKVVTVLPINTVPIASFTVTPNPQFETGTLTYVDSSTAGDSWDSIKTKTWAYSSNSGSTWSAESATAPKSFTNSGTYQIRLTVKDNGNALSASKTDTDTKTVVIVQPKAMFIASPKPQLSGYTIIYNDTSLTNISGNAISAREWSYSSNNGVTWSTATATAPTNLITLTTTNYKIRERVKSTATSVYPSIWSDYYIDSLDILEVLTLTNFKITNLVNPPTPYDFPILSNLMPANIKAGYNNTFSVDVLGTAKNISVAISDNNGNNLGKVYMSKIKDIDSRNSVWGFSYATLLDTPVNTIINFKILGQSESTIFDYNTRTPWNGDILKVIGSALDDTFVNRIY